MNTAIKCEEFNGWKNYETWNVALWIGNDEGLMTMARYFRRNNEPYKRFINMLQSMLAGQTLSIKTPDDVRWDSDLIDTEALNEMISEL